MSDEKSDKDSGASKPAAKDTSADRASGPTASRQQKRREERLRLIEEQVADGSLVIRQMTPEERIANPPKNRGKKRGR